MIKRHPELRRRELETVHDERSRCTELVALGHAPTLITSHRGPPRRSSEHGYEIHRHWRPPEPWTQRNVEPHLSHVPFSYLSLVAGEHDLAHAVYPTDALAAVRWGGRAGRPAIEDPSTAAACRRRAEQFDRRSAAEAHLELYRELLAR